MKIEIHNGLTNPQVIHATRVVVYDEFDNPVALALSYGHTNDGRELILAAHAGEMGKEAQFNQLLERLGIRKTVLVTNVVTGTELDKVRFQ
jgi:hypothetical protein